MSEFFIRSHSFINVPSRTLIDPACWPKVKKMFSSQPKKGYVIISAVRQEQFFQLNSTLLQPCILLMLDQIHYDKSMVYFFRPVLLGLHRPLNNSLGFDYVNLLLRQLQRQGRLSKIPNRSTSKKLFCTSLVLKARYFCLLKNLCLFQLLIVIAKGKIIQWFLT